MNSIFLYGAPGSGKSTLGLALSERLGMPFIDIDSRIEHVAGRRIAAYMAENGEPAFRELESETLREVCRQAQTLPAVVALGGGALLREQNLRLAQDNGEVIFLDADIKTLISRLGEDDPTRPLLAGDTRAKITELMQAREAHYSQFTFRVDNSGSRETSSAVEEIIRRRGVYTLRAMGRPYSVHIGQGVIEKLPVYLHQLNAGEKIVVVYDTNTHNFFSSKVKSLLEHSGIRVEEVIILAGEENKTLKTVTGMWDAFITAGMDRKSIVLAVGGGVVSDMTGFAASTYMRGCRWLALPTSLLAMVDAAIGGKTGFDLPQGKNLIGSFYPPELVLIDPDVLATLPKDEYISGLAEVVKHGIIADPQLFETCAKGLDAIVADQAEVVKRAAKVKINVIEEDPYEKGKRASLNLGHTIGHAIEIESEFTLKHGEAIAIGTVAEARLAERMGIAKEGLSEKIAGVFSTLGLPVKLPSKMNRLKVISFMGNDKKKSGKQVNFALPAAIGDVRTGIAISNLEETL